MNRGVGRYLILARFRREDIIPARTCLLEGAARLSVDHPHVAFSSDQGDTVGLLVRSEMAAAQIIYSLTNDYVSGDHAFIMVMGINPDWSAVGSHTSWEWLFNRGSAQAGTSRHKRKL